MLRAQLRQVGAEVPGVGEPLGERAIAEQSGAHAEEQDEQDHSQAGDGVAEEADALSAFLRSP